MSALGWTFQQASGPGWFAPLAATGEGDGLFALLPASESEAAVLALTASRDLLNYPLDRVPAGSTLLGFRLQAFALKGAAGRGLFPGEPAPVDGGLGQPAVPWQVMSFALTLDGSTPATAWRSVPLPLGHEWRGVGDYDAPVELTVGGDADLWGFTWAVQEVNSAGFGVLIRRLSTGSLVGDVLIDSAALIVTYTPPAGVGGGGAPSGDAMPIRDTSRQYSRIGKETTRGTAVGCPVRLRGMHFAMNPVETGVTRHEAGQKVASDYQLHRESASGSIEEGIPNYDEMGILFQMLFGDPATSTLASGVFRHTWHVRRLTADQFRTFTHQFGEDGELGEQTAFTTLSGLTLGLNSQSAPSLGGSLVSRKIASGTSLSAGANEIQRLTWSATPSAGTFKLSYNGEETAAITGGASIAAAIATALNALTQVGASGVTVSGTGASYDITFGGTAMAGRTHPLLVLANNSITGTPTLTVTRQTAGGYTEYGVVPILASQWDVYLATTHAGLAAARLTACKTAGLNLENKLEPVHFADQALGTDFSGLAEGRMGLTMPLMVETGSNGMALLGHRRSNTPLFARLLCTGPVIASAINHRLQVDMACRVSESAQFSDEEGIYAKGFTLGARFDASWGNSAVFTLENGVASY